MRKESGFTLVEMVIVMVIIAIGAAIAIPNLISWLPNYRLRSATQDLFNNIQLAKLTAIKQNTNCAVTFPADGSGYTVFVDADDDFNHDSGEEIKPTVLWAQYNGDVSVTGNTFDASTGQPTFAFQPSGLTTDNGGGFANGTVSLDNTNGRNTSVVVSQAGHIRIP